ncbi:hypothetical protein KKD61_00890, partial [Patescibacteria group bacterium]|nr:hypothetical protein [Patescibacteria group bacterium]
MIKKTEIKSIIFIALSFLGLLAASLLVKRTLELRRQAAYGTVSLSLLPSPTEICTNQFGPSYIYLKLNPNSFSVGAAELAFSFDQSSVRIGQVQFHSAYAASMIRKNEGGELWLTILTTATQVPNQGVFDLAKIEVWGERISSSTFKLTSHNIKGTRGSDDPALDRDLNLLNPDSVITQIDVRECPTGSGTPVPTGVSATPTRRPSATPTGAPGGARVRVSPQTQTIDRNQQTTVNINIDNINGLYGFQLDVSYQGSVLSYLNWAKGTFFSQSGDVNEPFWVSPQVSGGSIRGVAATRLNPDSPISGSGVLLTLTFRGISGGNSPIAIENASFSDRDGNRIPVSVENGAIIVSGAVVTVSPTTRPTATPSRRPTTTTRPTATVRPTATPSRRPTTTGYPTATIRPTATTRPTATPTSIGPTPTSWPTGWPTVTPTGGVPTPTIIGPFYRARINFRVGLVGTRYDLSGRPVIVSDIPALTAKVAVRSGGYWEVFDNVVISFDQNAVGSGSVEVQKAVRGAKYAVLIKGPIHLAKRFCQDNQAGHCWLGEENISLVEGDNNFNWVGAELEPGDLNIDGVVDSIDFSLLKSAIGKQGSGVWEDVNYNGRVDTQDL